MAFEDPGKWQTSFNFLAPPPSCIANWRPVPLCQSMQGLQDVSQHTQQQCWTHANNERLLRAFVPS